TGQHSSGWPRCDAMRPGADGRWRALRKSPSRSLHRVCRRTGRRRKVSPPAGRRETLQAERGLVERDLLVPAELVGQLLPRRRDAVGAGLGIGLAGEGLRQLVLRQAVILEDARNARLDGAVRVVVGVELGGQVVGDEGPVIARTHPLVDIVLAVAVALEAR